MRNQNPNEKDHVELPKSLVLDTRRNYSPMNTLLEGYNQMPRQLVPPYQNQYLKLKQDSVTNARAKETTAFFKNVVLNNRMAASEKKPTNSFTQPRNS